MNLTKGQKEKMQALEEAILSFEQSERNAEEYEHFIYKVITYLRAGEHPLTNSLIKEVIKQAISKRDHSQS